MRSELHGRWCRDFRSRVTKGFYDVITESDLALSSSNRTPDLRSPDHFFRTVSFYIVSNVVDDLLRKVDYIIKANRLITIDGVAYWDILILPPILILIDSARFHNNTQDQEHLSGDTNPEAKSHHTHDSKFKEQRKHFTSLDILVQLMIQEELQRIEKKSAASSK
ncbi:hypothetical protein TNCV_2522961 [Trichonephila clavipes]|nr:hypothetical protein TNCV_2522961 [Trichonephila clavipes]